MSVSWCHGINTNSEVRLKHGKGDYPQYSVFTAKKCNISFHMCVLG